MKSEDFAALATDIALLLSASGAVPAADAWKTLSGVFNVKPAAKVSEVCKAMSGISNEALQVSINQPRVELIIESIPVFNQLFARIAKAALVKDLNAIAGAIEPFGDMMVSDFSVRVTARLMQPVATKPGVNLELVERYVASLEQTYRDEASFKLAYAALKADKSAKGPEVKEIAKRFAGAGGKNKNESLNGIWRRHEVILIDRAKDAATAGRTAA